MNIRDSIFVSYKIGMIFSIQGCLSNWSHLNILIIAKCALTLIYSFHSFFSLASLSFLSYIGVHYFCPLFIYNLLSNPSNKLIISGTVFFTSRISTWFFHRFQLVVKFSILSSIFCSSYFQLHISHSHFKLFFF